MLNLLISKQKETRFQFDMNEMIIIIIINIIIN